MVRTKVQCDGHIQIEHVQKHTFHGHLSWVPTNLARARRVVAQMSGPLHRNLRHAEFMVERAYLLGSESGHNTLVDLAGMLAFGCTSTYHPPMPPIPVFKKQGLGSTQNKFMTLWIRQRIVSPAWDVSPIRRRNVQQSQSIRKAAPAMATSFIEAKIVSGWSFDSFRMPIWAAHSVCTILLCWFCCFFIALPYISLLRFFRSALSAGAISCASETKRETVRVLPGHVQTTLSHFLKDMLLPLFSITLNIIKSSVNNLKCPEMTWSWSHSTSNWRVQFASFRQLAQGWNMVSAPQELPHFWRAAFTLPGLPAKKLQSINVNAAKVDQ